MITVIPETTYEPQALLREYEHFLSAKAEGTKVAYLRTVRQLIGWVTERPDNNGQFRPLQLTKQIVELYLAQLEQAGLSLHHRARVKSSISNFAQFLIEEKGLLQRNPTRGIELPSIPLFPPQQLSSKQRSIIRTLVEQAEDQRGSAIFALCYWAGCRVSDISWLQIAHTHIDPKKGWLQVGLYENKRRDIDLLNKARKPLYAYLQSTRETPRTYVFISQRGERLTEEGIYYWFRMLKAQATEEQREVIADVTLNDLRQNFGRRARDAGWSLEEVTQYLGFDIKKGSFASFL